MPPTGKLRSIDVRENGLHALFVRAVDATGKSRYAIAGELGVSEAILSRYYTGKRPPSLELLCEVATLARLQLRVTMAKSGGGDRA